MFFDTGGLVALALPDDPLHRLAEEIYEAAKGPHLVTEYVLWETLNGLSGVRYRARGHWIVGGLIDDPQCEVIPASPRLWEAGFSLHLKRPDKDWSLTDCISFIVMNERGIVDALAHDHHFEQAGFRPLLRELP